MGMDILIAELPMAEGREPDWTAARQALAEMTDEALEDLAFDLRAVDDEDAPASAVRAALSGVVDRVENAINDGSRELSTIEVPGWRIYLTGGQSWGDPPTELFEDFLDLDEAGLSAAAGFVPPEAA